MIVIFFFVILNRDVAKRRVRPILLWSLDYILESGKSRHDDHIDRSRVVLLLRAPCKCVCQLTIELVGLGQPQCNMCEWL